MCTRSHPEEDQMATKCDARTEVYSRVCGFFRPVQQWNKGKKEEFKDRAEYLVAQKSKD
nr:anaerobic ribonucleoside-triphosphate reductase [Geothermobacter hydrogeniphilus]